MKRIHLILFSLILSLSVCGQLNTKRILDNGRNALYFEDYVLSIQYFNKVIELKPHIPESYYYRAVAKIYLEDYLGAEADCNKAVEINPFNPDFYYTRGFARKKMDKLQEAKADFNKAIEYAPENFDYFIHRIELFEQLDETNSALDDIEFLLSHKYKNKDLVYLEKAQILLKKTDTLVAKQMMDSLILKDTTNAYFYNIRAYIHLTQKEDSSALYDYNKSISLDTLNPSTYINRGILAYRIKDYRTAISDYNKAVELDSSNTQALFNRGLLRTEVGDNNNAIKDFSRILHLDEENDDARFQRATVLLSLKNYNLAITDFDRIIKKYPDFIPAYYGKADAEEGLNNMKQASIDRYKAHLIKEEYKNGKTKSPKTDTQIANNQPSLTDKIKNYDESESSENKYDDKIRGKIQDQYADARLIKNYIISYYSPNNNLRKIKNFSTELNQFNKELNSDLKLTNEEIPLSKELIAMHFRRIESINQQLRIDSLNPKLYMLKGINNALVINLDDAVNDFNQAINIDPSMTLAYFNRANIRFKLLDFSVHQTNAKKDKETEKTNAFIAELILHDYSQVIKLSPDFFYAWLNKGNCYFLRQDYENAIKCFTETIKINNGLGEAYMNRAICYLYLNDKENALADFSKAGELGLYQAYNLIKRFK